MTSRRYVFTINNYNDGVEEHLAIVGHHPDVTYLVYGREVGESGTPHLQGFMVCRTPLRFECVAQLLWADARPHVEVARGTSQAALSYCKKDGDFVEYGQVPTEQGKTNRFEEFKTWVLDQPDKPTARQIAEHHPGIFLQYSRAMEWVDLVYPIVRDVVGEFRAYQLGLAQILLGEPQPRKIIFVVDEVGNTGKSWFVRKFLFLHESLTQVLSVGKRDDLAHAIDSSRRVFLFDLPRSSSEFLQYTVLEQLKDGIVFSPKYNSRTKLLDHGTPHVVVFMNEQPDRNKLSRDRYQVINWVSLN
jgi:hypothetical protein